MKTTKIITSLAIFFLAFASLGSLQAEEPQKVVIIPFTMNADRDLSFLREGIVDMLTTRLSWENKVTVIPKDVTRDALKAAPGAINDSLARQVGAAVGADYVLFGSLTVFGESVSMDAKMIDVGGVKDPITVFNQSQGMDMVIPKVNDFAQEINEKAFGRVVAQRPPAPSPAPQPQTTPSTYAHPDTLLGSQVDDRRDEVSGLNPDFIMAGGGRGSSPSFWKSRSFEENIRAISIGDIDGDGQLETVFIGVSRLYVYKNAQQRFIKVYEMAGSPQHRYLSVDVADINGNEKAEIFVTVLDNQPKRLDSFVLEWNGSGLSPISENNNWYYRVLDVPYRGRVLFGQKRSPTTTYLPGIHELAWQNGTYESASILNLPNDTNVFGFMIGDIKGDGTESILSYDEYDHLWILGLAGDREWKSEEPYGGSVNYLEDTSPANEPTSPEDTRRVFIGQRIFIKDFDNDGKPSVIVAKNQGTASRLFARLRNFTHCEIVGLSWDGLGLSANWKTRKISGYVSDFAIEDFDNDGQDEMVAAVVLSQGASLLKNPKSAIISYDLAVQGSQEQAAQQ